MLPRPPFRSFSQMREFIESESTAGLVLMAAAATALLLANSPLSEQWFHLLHRKLGPLSLLHWINDGLMAVFFLLVGLEIKRELLDGQLSGWKSRILPGSAALAGMAAPALIFLFVNRADAANLRGWAIPSATDIAFALGVLAILGRHAPGPLKPLLTAIAVLDDLGAVVVIALFYTATIAGGPLLAAAGLTALLFLLNRFNVSALTPYLFLGTLLWVAIFLSGVHATVAGVITALFIPLKARLATGDNPRSPLHQLEHRLHPWVAYAIVPLFGLANAGVDLRGLNLSVLFNPLPLGIALGLFLGKQLGIFTACVALIRLGWAEAPPRVSGWHLYGVSVLCGIGFTMSLFIGSLAFGQEKGGEDLIKIGVLAGSTLSALLGALILRLAPARIHGT